MAADIIKKDFLWKRAQMKSRITKENYKQRWFELTADSLRYSDGSLESGIGSRVKGRILLQKIVTVEAADSDPLGNRVNAFQVAYKEDEKNILYIIANSEQQRNEWISAIREESVKAGAALSTMYHPGVWLQRHNKYSCCDSINKRSDGCANATVSSSNHNNVVASQLHNVIGNSLSPHQPGKNSALRPLPPPPSKEPPPPVPQKSEVTKVLALYSYTALEPNDLDLQVGEEYELVGENSDTSSWWFARNKSGKVGYIPANYVQKVDDNSLDQYDWFYPKTSRTQSEEILQSDGREGVFLVRESSQKDTYTLSVFTKSAGLDQGLVKHYHIKINAENKYFLADKHPFLTIPELIYYHKHNCAGLIVRLRFPPGDRSCLKPTCGLGHDLKEIDQNLLEMKEELGSGQFGKVYRAIYMGRVEVAVKMMREGTMHQEDFIEEAKTMMKLQHENLVKLYGVCTKKQPILIVTEFLRNGALLTYLRRYKQRLLINTDTLIDMCIQICQGMRYLEEQAVIHRDLAARNCLVGDKGIVKVGDFGLARYVLDNEYTSSTGAKFPVKWSAPEVLNFTKFSSKSDIWAYGILMWEIFSGGETPYNKMKNADVVYRVCNERYRLSQPPQCPEPVYAIMMSCWNQTPDKRPNFTQLHEELNAVHGVREYED